VIAIQPSERAAELERVVAAYLAAGVEQRPPETRARLAAATEPVVNHADLHASLGASNQCGAKLPADLVVANDVILEQDALLCGAHGGQPRREIFRRVDQQIDAIAFDQRCAGCTTQPLPGEVAQVAVGGKGSGVFRRHARPLQTQLPPRSPLPRSAASGPRSPGGAASPASGICGGLVGAG